MGKNSKGIGAGAASGAAAGSSLGPWGAVGGAVLGGVMGANTGGEAPDQVQQLDPAFMNHLYNQSMGTEQTAADAKMKASFNQTLAQQVAAARAARGVNPALLQRNVARIGAEQNAQAAQLGEQENLRNQDDARSRYMQAVGMNQNAQRLNSLANTGQDERSRRELGGLINGMGAIGSTFTTADASKAQSTNSKDLPQITPGSDKAAPQEAFQGPPMNSAQVAAKQSTDMSLGADLTGQSDKRSKQKIKSEMVVTSDERQKDLIKNESLPTPQQQQVPQQQPMQTPMMAAQNVAPVAPQQPVAPLQPAVQPPAPTPANQTALGQANMSLAKGGRIDDLATRDTSQLVKPADGPSAQDILAMSTDAQRRQTRDMFGNVTQSDAENYQANLGRWHANQAAQRAEYTKQMDQAGLDNTNINNERSARLAKFYTGTSAANANDIAQRYTPQVVTPNASWQSAQSAQAAAGIGDQSRGYNYTLAGRALAAPIIGGAAAVATSDETQKQDIKSESAPQQSGDSMNPKNFLDKLTAYSYEYKNSQKQNPHAGQGKYLSVMAQDLEKAGPVGQSMVKQDESGTKQVDYGKGFGAILAAQVQLNERLKAIEAKKGKV